ncbi:MAG: TPM domain-containing protein [Sulfurovaceae bacterium]|nr:TPM domain-containing protein [Sulfurovaceae bacterium]
MKNINKQMKLDIEKAIAKVEEKSSCELVAVITQKSGNYSFIALLIVSILTLMLPAFILLYRPFVDALLVYQIQIVFFVIVFLLLSIENILIWFLPKSILQKKAKLKAFETFNILGLQKTSNHQAVMIYVSVYERYVQILTDSGINSQIDNDVWQNTVNKFTTMVKNKKFGAGYLKAIEEIGEILIEKFPVQENDKNELPNYLIEI